MAEFKLELVGETQLQIVDKVHPIAIGDPSEIVTSRGSYIFRGISFLDDKSKVANAGLFEIPPGVATRAFLITGDVRSQDTTVYGEGYVFMLRPSADSAHPDPFFDLYNLNARSRPDYVLEYGKGTFLSYLAGKEGMKVLGLYHPPFTDNMEITAEEEGQTVVGDLVIPSHYWENRKKFIDQYSKP